MLSGGTFEFEHSIAKRNLSSCSSSIMTAEAEEESGNDTMSRCCANCGAAEVEGNGVKLRSCSACHLVKYCSFKCQGEHRSKHKRECKKRVAELRDEILFKHSQKATITALFVSCRCQLKLDYQL